MYLPWAVDEFQSIILMVGWWTVRWRACTHTPRHQGCVCVLNFNIQLYLHRALHYTLTLQIHMYICMKNTSAKQNKEWEEVSLLHFSPRSWVLSVTQALPDWALHPRPRGPGNRQNIKTESCNISTSIYMTFYSRKVVIKTFFSSSIIPDAVVWH